MINHDTRPNIDLERSARDYLFANEAIREQIAQIRYCLQIFGWTDAPLEALLSANRDLDHLVHRYFDQLDGARFETGEE